MMRFIHTSKTGAEGFLERELAAGGQRVEAAGPGWLLTTAGTDAILPADLCFPTVTLPEPALLTGGAVNRLAEELAGFFAGAFRGVRVDKPWPVLFLTADIEGLAPWAHAIEKEWLARMSGRMSRVFKLAVSGLPAVPGPAVGMAVLMTGFDQLQASCSFHFWGQRRMRDDPRAPSRSFLKIEEAYGIFGQRPGPGESVADLGAAPGGWTWSALRGGATVVAVDNGPLKGAAAGHPGVKHLCADAFTFSPPRGQCFDWLFADVIDNPYRVLERLETWVLKAWCRRFIVNIKFGHHDPLALLGRLRAPVGILAKHCARMQIRQLLHDREEFTVMGELG